MPTTAELLALGGHLEVALVMPFDGIEIAFTDHRDLVGLVTGAGRDDRLGLQRHEGRTMRLATNLRAVVVECERNPIPATLPLFAEVAKLVAARFTAA